MENTIPTYEFVCEKCDIVFEIDCPYEDKDKAKCPRCRSKKIKEIFDSAEIIWKTKGRGGE
jgi:putative FmdB family regulatory protein